MRPKASIIICTRNRPKLLMERSLPSALNQAFSDYEILVVNDASDEEYYVPVHEMTKVRYFRNDTRLGLAGSKNFGLSVAKGEYIVFLDDDNSLDSEFLYETCKYLAENDADAVGTWRTVVYPEGRVRLAPNLPCAINDGFLIKREVFDTIKFDADLHANEDADFGIEFFKRFKMGIVEKNLMTAWASPIFNTTSYSDYTDFHLDGLCKFWLKHHQYDEYIGRMFMLRSGKKWFRWMYWIEAKLKRYSQWLS